MSVPPTRDAIGYENINPLDPSYVIVLQVVESFSLGMKHI